MNIWGCAPPKVLCFAPAALAPRNIWGCAPPKVLCFAPAALAPPNATEGSPTWKS
jgi:hypothetical protein